MDSFNGLTVSFAKQKHATVMVRGLRAVTDFENEIQLAHTNFAMMPEHRDGVPGHGHQVELPFLHHRAGGRPLRAGCFPASCRRNVERALIAKREAGEL